MQTKLARRLRTTLPLALLASLLLFGSGCRLANLVFEILEERRRSEEAFEVSSIPERVKQEGWSTGRYLSLEIWGDGRTNVVAQRRDNPIDFDELQLGRRDKREPVNFVKPLSLEEVEAVTFDEGDLDFTAVAKMAEDAPKRLGIEDGKVWRLECARAAPRACTLQCTVEVMGSRRSGSAFYDGKGKRAERADFPKYNPIDPLDPGRKGDKCRRVVLPPI